MTAPTALPNSAIAGRHSSKDKTAYGLAEAAFQQSSLPVLDKLENFPRFSTKRALARFMAKEQLFQQILPITGIIVECGVYNGAGLFTWAQLSNIHEPVNYTRKIVGFDTFEGFPSVNAVDNQGSLHSQPGDICGSPLEELERSVEKYNSERHLAHIPNVELVKGDFTQTAAQYLEANPHTIISLLYLDFDLYEPTKKALELFLPRMPKGAIVAFDEINCESFPGETRALQEIVGIGTHEIRRFPFEPWVSYMVL
ncbi:dTDP-6-deoxy-L-hexose 3-O-methyltransferase [Microvirgula aerodenitrificans]|uniref:dTDP-6-deoxy-L-hexose 3-O-methyltransferase n=1 Tax=Microvirgula aerodenitrificans TaxID=57480 RepID=A0A2S0PBG5_9NEIS|nr:TylF/MycF/NovP-related O-methyltransferase [Microvirgula aerodenitrificans]AVY94672.1 dTDP-6-deoxy-L-hexose 3-O-methyltransferase [Microvirgula aerodenitrificans]